MEEGAFCITGSFGGVFCDVLRKGVRGVNDGINIIRVDIVFEAFTATKAANAVGADRLFWEGGASCQ